MAENEAYGGQLHDESKSRSKLRWREKIFHGHESSHKEGGNKFRLNEDVIDFLKPSNHQTEPDAGGTQRKSSDRPVGSQSQSPQQPYMPRIDVSTAQRWPAAAPIINPRTPALARSATSGAHMMTADSARRPGKWRRNTNVGFARSAPEIIGEGGDDAEEPPIEVSRRKPKPRPGDADSQLRDSSRGSGNSTPPVSDMHASSRSAPLHRSRTAHGQGGSATQGRWDARPPPYDEGRESRDDEFRPTSLQRARTGLLFDFDINPADANHLHLPTDSLRPEKRTSFSAVRRSQMMSEEGKALNQSFDSDSDLEALDNDTRPSSSSSNIQTRNTTPTSVQQIYNSYAALDTPESKMRSNSVARGNENQMKRESPVDIIHSSNDSGMALRRKPTDNRPPSSNANPPYPNAPPAYQAFSKSGVVQAELAYRAAGPRGDDKTDPTRPNPSLSRQPSISPSPSSAAKGDAAVDDFARRVTYMMAIFRLTCELEGPVTSFSAFQWIRASIWWFLKARGDLEALIRSKSRASQPRTEAWQGDTKLTQPHVDLAKSWWVVNEVIPATSNLARYGDTVPSQLTKARNAGDQNAVEILEAVSGVLAGQKTLIQSMSRNQMMPPHQSLLQGQDQTIWIKYPKFAADVEAVLAGKSSRSLLADTPTKKQNPMSLIPVGDNAFDFCYGRFFVHVALVSEDEMADQVSLSCVLSILRGYNDWNLKVTLCTQSELLNIVVQSDRKAGPTWDDVTWNTKARILDIRLSRGFALNVGCSENDYKTLLGIYDYTRKVERSMYPQPDERLLHEVTLKDFHYSVTSGASPFAGEKLQRCRVRVFERILMTHEGGKSRQFHRGYRLMIVSSPKSRTLSQVSHELSRGKLMNFEFKSKPDADGAVAMILKFRDKTRLCTALLVFEATHQRDGLYSILNGMTMDSDEAIYAQIQFRGLLVDSLNPGEALSAVARDFLKHLEWNDCWVTNKQIEEPADNSKTIQSDSLRAIFRHAAGSMTDRVNIGPGELRLRLDPLGAPDIKMLRQPQEDIAMSIEGSQVGETVADSLVELMALMTASPTIRTFKFRTMDDLHKYQTAVTGFNVKYDGMASSFAISRRRMVVPIYKKLGASHARIQIVQQENMYQLLAFFEDYGVTDAMNFPLKSMDVFEKSEKGGKAYVKLVDAKFALPSKREEVRNEEDKFICLDIPEYPGEHDDINIGFDSAEERDKFVSALPAAPQISRAVTFRRKG